jgi:hypothetical protein
LKEDTETHLTGFAKAAGISHSIVFGKDNTYIRFECGDAFKAGLTNPLKLMDGRTIGQAERDGMHEKLDAWIEGNLK